jgi:hypothetical protein
LQYDDWKHAVAANVSQAPAVIVINPNQFARKHELEFDP